MRFASEFDLHVGSGIPALMLTFNNMFVRFRSMGGSQARPWMTFGQRIRELRMARNLTQRELADRIGINFTYLSKIENDRLEQDQSPKEETIKKLATALHADYDELMLLARKIPEQIKERVIQRPDVFRKMAALDDEALDRLLKQIDKESKP